MKTTDNAVKVKSKFPLGIKIASILACVAVLSVGFASWLVLRPVEQTNQLGSFTTYTVSEQGVDVTIEATADDADIVFGYGTSSVTNKWLKYESGMEAEDLTATFKISFNVADDTDTDYITDVANNLTINFNPNITVDSKYVTVSSVKYGIADVSAGKTEYNTVSYDGSLTLQSNGSYEATITPGATETNKVVFVKVQFAWGSATDTQNPYTYFNSVEYGDAHADDDSKTNGEVAVEMLEAINAANSAAENQAFEITVTGTKTN